MTRTYLRKGINSATGKRQAGAAAPHARPDSNADAATEPASAVARNRAPTPSREMEMLMERRARDGGTLSRLDRFKLSVPEAIKAELAADWHLHWLNDTDARILDMTKNDYYVEVAGVAPIVVGMDKFGKPMVAKLYKKPLAFYLEDRRVKDADIADTMSGIAKGTIVGGADALPQGVSYMPDGSPNRSLTG